MSVPFALINCKDKMFVNNNSHQLNAPDLLDTTKNSQLIFSRNDLKSLKEKRDGEIYQQNIDRLVNSIKATIINIATTSTNTSYFYSAIVPNNPDDIQFKTIMDTISKLKEIFIDVSIEYKTQKDLRTGREFNQGIYIDWS